MHSEDHWIIASRKVPVLDKEDRQKVLELGGLLGGGWMEVHRHIFCTPTNRKEIESTLKESGYTISTLDDHSFVHPEDHQEEEHHDSLEESLHSTK